MKDAGYSGTPLIKKLGLDSDKKLCLINEPKNYFGLLGENIQSQLINKNELPDLIHLFVTSKKEFETEMKKLKPIYKSKPSISIWVSWYKKSSGLNTDITEDTIRNYALANDLVDIKVCAVSDIWSGLKLVVPKVKRQDGES
jgi:hypothetical protein